MRRMRGVLQGERKPRVSGVEVGGVVTGVGWGGVQSGEFRRMAKVAPADGVDEAISRKVYPVLYRWQGRGEQG